MSNIPIEIAEINRIQHHYALLLVFGLLAIASLLIIFVKRNNPIPLRMVDLFPGLYLFYVIILGDTNNSLFHNEKFIWFSIALLAFYPLKMALENLRALKVLVFVLIVLLSHQCILGLLQLYKFEPSNYSGQVTGSFFNPALLGGYLASLFPFFLVFNPEFSFKRKDLRSGKYLKSLALPGLVLVLIVLPVTLSRAAWMAVMAGSAFVLLKSAYANRLLVPFKRLRPLLRKLIIGIFALIVLGAFIGMYFLKKDSANGRMLMWKVSLFMWSENPVTGHGFDAVNAHYLNYQADYFRLGKASENEEMLAGNVHWSFNEFLQIGAETGIVGVILLFGWIGLLLFSKPADGADERFVTASKGGLIALLTFGMFSYPFYSPPLFFNLIIFGAIMSVYAKVPWFFNFRIVSSKWTGIIIPLLCLAAFAMLVPKMIDRYQAYWYWDEANQLYNIEEYKLANESFQEAYLQLKANGKFLCNYGKSLEMAEDYRTSAAILNDAKYYWSDEVLYNTLGNVYKALGDYDKAEEAYQQASYIIPHKFYPHYLMFKMYVENGEYEKAMNKANYIKNKPVKIHSKALDEIYEEVDEFIKTQ